MEDFTTVRKQNEDVSMRQCQRPSRMTEAWRGERERRGTVAPAAYSEALGGSIADKQRGEQAEGSAFFSGNRSRNRT